VLQSLDDDKGLNIVSIPLAGKSSIADFMVIASGGSSRQVAAMAEHIDTRLKKAGVEVLGKEGAQQADWVLLDTAEVVVHLFRPEVRDFYALERMWQPDSVDEVVHITADALLCPIAVYVSPICCLWRDEAWHSGDRQGKGWP